MVRFPFIKTTRTRTDWGATFRRLLPIALIAITASACVSTREVVVTELPLTETETPPEPIIAVPTASATIPPPTTPTITPTATALTLGGPNISYNGISFTIDPILGDRVFARIAPASPGYTEFSFAPGTRCQVVGCVTVYRVDAFKTYPFGSEIITDLQAAIETGSDEYFPTRASAILLRAQTQHTRFQNGAGIRAIVMRGQNGYLANNQAVEYDFHGLSADGQYYVQVTFPVDASILLSTYDPAENTNPAAFLVPEIPEGPPFGATLEGVMLEYNQEAQRQLDALESAGFLPDLGLLDALIDSLWITTPSDG